ncbi:MAG: S41 family peptidase, partial [Bacteroidota bacterium]
LTIRSFKTMEFYNGNYYRFLRNTFDSIKTLGLDQLVVDIRNNTGGSSGRINYLYAFLAERPFQFSSRATLTGPTQAVAGEDASTTQRRLAGAVSKRERKIQKALTKFLKPRKKKERYTGRVVVLINEVSFSASGMFARFVQGSGRGKLVGMTSGAAAGTTFGGNSKTRKPIYLGPNDALELRVNTIGLTLPFPIAGNVTPDLMVPISKEGLQTGTDEQMEAALKVVSEVMP